MEQERLLREHGSSDDILSTIPSRSQHGFKTIDVKLTCIDATKSHLLFGTNIGAAFLHNRETRTNIKLLSESRHDVITSVKLLVGIECQAALGTSDGKLTIVIFSTSTAFNAKQVQKYSLGNIHQSEVTTMCWSSNGMKLFTGDKRGNIYVSELDFVKKNCNASIVLTEQNEIVDIEYKHMILLVSTTERTFLFDSNRQENKVVSIGSKPSRRGYFGSCFNTDTVLASDLRVFCTRPGHRIWVADIEGRVINTLLMKKSVSSVHHNIKIGDEDAGVNASSTKDVQFGRLIDFGGQYLVTYSVSSLFVIDHESLQIVGSNQNLNDLVSVAVTTDEIFLLRWGRKLHRISLNPEDKRVLVDEDTKKQDVQPVNFKDVKESLSGMKKTITPLVGALHSKMTSFNAEAEQWTQKLQTQAKVLQKKIPGVASSLFSKDPDRKSSTSLSSMEECLDEDLTDHYGNGRKSELSQSLVEEEKEKKIKASQSNNSSNCDVTMDEPLHVDSNFEDVKTAKDVIYEEEKNHEQEFLHSQGDASEKTSVNSHFEKLSNITLETDDGEIVFNSKRKKKSRTASSSKSSDQVNMSNHTPKKENLTSDLHSSRVEVQMPKVDTDKNSHDDLIADREVKKAMLTEENTEVCLSLGDAEEAHPSQDPQGGNKDESLGGAKKQQTSVHGPQGVNKDQSIGGAKEMLTSLNHQNDVFEDVVRPSKDPPQDGAEDTPFPENCTNSVKKSKTSASSVDVKSSGVIGIGEQSTNFRVSFEAEYWGHISTRESTLNPHGTPQHLVSNTLSITHDSTTVTCTGPDAKPCEMALWKQLEQKKMNLVDSSISSSLGDKEGENDGGELKKRLGDVPLPKVVLDSAGEHILSERQAQGGARVSQDVATNGARRSQYNNKTTHDGAEEGNDTPQNKLGGSNWKEGHVNESTLHHQYPLGDTIGMHAGRNRENDESLDSLSKISKPLAGGGDRGAVQEMVVAIHKTTGNRLRPEIILSPTKTDKFSKQFDFSNSTAEKLGKPSISQKKNVYSGKETGDSTQNIHPKFQHQHEINLGEACTLESFRLSKSELSLHSHMKQYDAGGHEITEEETAEHDGAHCSRQNEEIVRKQAHQKPSDNGVTIDSQHSEISSIESPNVALEDLHYCSSNSGEEQGPTTAKSSSHQEELSSLDDIYRVESGTRDFSSEIDSDPEDSVSDEEHINNSDTEDSEFTPAATYMSFSNPSDPAKLLDNWSMTSAPHQVISISGSGNYIWYIDYYDHIYITEDVGRTVCDIKWKKICKKGVQLAVSPSGDFTWLVSRRGNVYASTPPHDIQQMDEPIRLEWQLVGANVSRVALGIDSAWAFTTSSKMKAQMGLSRTIPFAKCWDLFDWNHGKVTHISMTKSCVWCRTDSSKLFCGNYLSIESQDFEWEEVDPPVRSDNTPVMIESITSDLQYVLWGVDNYGLLWFLTEDMNWWRVNITQYMDEKNHKMSPVMQSLPSSVSSSMQRMQSWMAGSVRVQNVAVNNRSVWVVYEKQKIHIARGPLTGCRWVVTTPLGVAKSTRWQHITTSSVFSIEKGMWMGLIWASQPNNEIFSFPSQKVASVHPVTLVPPVAADASIVCMSACKEALWVLTDDGSIYIRSGISSECLQGSKWDKLDLTLQLGDIKIVHIGCGTQNVWAVDSTGQVFFRIGISAVDRLSLSPAWIPIDGCPSPASRFTKIECGLSDCSVWALDDYNNVYVRAGVSFKFLVGNSWEIVRGSHAQQLCISNHTVWGLRTSGNFLRRYGISERNQQGDYWKKLKGNFSKLAVTPYDELWAIDRDQHLRHQFTSIYCPLVVKVQSEMGPGGMLDADCNTEEKDDDTGWEIV